MYQIDFNKPEAIHFIGIGGISMSGLAEILIEEGFTVTGSDSNESDLTRHLEAKGAKVAYGQRAENITDEINVVVYTAAVHPDNPEFISATEKKLHILTRAELLGQMMKNYENAIAVSGTHGKTTTTSMITEILLSADTDPTISVGGILNSISGNIRVGGPDLFVTEACEYTNSFLSFYPTTEVILNIEADHLDFFKDLKEIRQSFRLFAEKLPENGLLVINKDIEHMEDIIEGLPCKVITFGKDQESRYQAENISYDELARASYDLLVDGEVIDTVTLGVSGEHNVYNSLAAAAVCFELGISLEMIQKGLKRFTGTNRRFEKKGEVSGVTIIDDYAHHPQEIRATLETAKHYPHKKLWVVFQPHTYTRTRAFLDEFAESLSLADEVILADIYAARETDNLGISSKDIAVRIEKKGVKVHYIPSFEEIETFILGNCIHGDLLITMGAGDIVKVGENLLGV
ncbi:UDP-N-acetylmuramate--L-alanine ligase [Lacrimispora algidixylanolytica]|uniref:UDP-N-acetylmuramate--L-alanine ligase n=1 Tax=Lacrimispora algidixylanolytica TaxID=94868 RepID=A0A419T5V7_9FIRM|nr:UDP-N-acetylmuramate--L-alanine ligase [Lacrimispora algidixylanolytica]RKD32832.1 UDP-N-acetylmuramate--L-alanine ligase [Lacrimispora algidixylanolytica]